MHRKAKKIVAENGTTTLMIGLQRLKHIVAAELSLDPLGCEMTWTEDGLLVEGIPCSSIFSVRPTRRGVVIRQVCDIVSQEYGVPRDEIMGRCRKREFVTARASAVFILRDVMKMTYVDIGKGLNRSHNSAIDLANKGWDITNSDLRAKKALERVKLSEAGRKALEIQGDDHEGKAK